MPLGAAVKRFCGICTVLYNHVIFVLFCTTMSSLLYCTRDYVVFVLSCTTIFTLLYSPPDYCKALQCPTSVQHLFSAQCSAVVKTLLSCWTMGGGKGEIGQHGRLVPETSCHSSYTVACIQWTVQCIYCTHLIYPWCRLDTGQGTMQLLSALWTFLAHLRPTAFNGLCARFLGIPDNANGINE